MTWDEDPDVNCFNCRYYNLLSKQLCMIQISHLK